MKVIALLPVKNEEWILPTTIPHLWHFADEILALDINSTDASFDLLKQFNVQVQPEGGRDPNNYSACRQRLLDWGRERGGTHFVWLDADEAFTSHFAPNLRATLGQLEPGQKLVLDWLSLWKSPFKIRADNSLWKDLFKDFVFCDDGKARFGDTRLHEGRTPGANTDQTWVRVPRAQGAVLHFQFVPAERFQIKQAYQRCREYVLRTTRNPWVLNEKYAITLDPGAVACVDVPPLWIAGLAGLDQLPHASGERYLAEIFDYFDQQDIRAFEPLQIWHIPELRAEFVRRTQRAPRPLRVRLLAWRARATVGRLLPARVRSLIWRAAKGV